MKAALLIIYMFAYSDSFQVTEMPEDRCISYAQAINESREARDKSVQRKISAECVPLTKSKTGN